MWAVRFKQLPADDRLLLLGGVQIAKRIASLALEQRFIAVAKNDIRFVSSRAHRGYDEGERVHVTGRLGESRLRCARFVEQCPDDPICYPGAYLDPVRASLAPDIGTPIRRVIHFLNALDGLT